MKRINILIIVLLVGLSAEAQKPLKDIVDISLPEEVKMISKEELNAIKRTKNELSPLNRKQAVGDNYRINGTLFQIYAEDGNTPKGRLDGNKKGLDEMFGWSPPKSYSSVIRSINNYRVLIINYEYQKEDYGYYTLYFINNTLTSSASMAFEYNKSDRRMTAKTVEEILRNITFKK